MSDEREMISTLRECCDNAWYRAVMERAADMIEGQLDVIECYEAMKEGVAIRIAELEQRLAAAEAALHGRSSECVYCRETLGVGPEDANHWETCDKHPARQRLAATEEAARWWRMAARGYILEEGEVHPDERWPWLEDEAKGGRDEE